MSSPGFPSNQPIPSQQPAPLAHPVEPAIPLARPVVLNPVPRPGHPTSLSAKPTPLALLAALKRRWIMALALGLLTGCSVAVGLWFLVPQAKTPVATTLHIDAKPQVIAFKEGEGNYADFNTYQKTQMAMVKSRLVLNAALRDPKVANLSVLAAEADPLTWLEKQLKVSFADSPEIMRIALEGDQPEQLRILVDAVAAAYLEEVVNRERIGTQKLVEQLKEFAKRYEDRVKSNRRTMRTLQEQMGAGDNQALVMRQQMAQLEMGLANQDLGRIRTELRNERARLKVLENKDGGPTELPEAEIQALVDKDELIRRYTSRQTELEAMIEEFCKQSVLKERDPLLQKPLQERRNLRESIDKRRKELHQLAHNQVAERSKMDRQSQTIQTRERVKVLEDLEKQLVTEVARLSKEAKGIVKGHLDVEEIRQDISHLEETARTMKTRAERLTIELEAPPRVYRLQDAVVYPVDQGKRRALIAGGGGLACLLLVMGLIAYLEFSSYRVGSANQLAQTLGVNVVGTLPTYSRRLGRGAVWQRQLVESVDAARTLLLRMAAVERLQAVMICSAVSGEGKTSLACHLATSLARAGRRTLLIDGDLRKPAAHHAFGLADQPGLCELLRGELSLAEAVQVTSVPGLALLAAGRCDELALQALAQHGISAFLHVLRASYDFILIDSSPVLPVADSLIVAQNADGVLFSVMQHISRLPKVYAAAQRLAAVGARILGAVVTGGQEDVYGSLVQYGTPRPTQP